jgi:hypothetical protein
VHSVDRGKSSMADLGSQLAVWSGPREHGATALDCLDPASANHVWPDGKGEWALTYLAEALDSVLSITVAAATAGDSRSTGVLGSTGTVCVKGGNKAVLEKPSFHPDNGCSGSIGNRAWEDARGVGPREFAPNMRFEGHDLGECMAVSLRLSACRDGTDISWLILNWDVW